MPARVIAGSLLVVSLAPAAGASGLYRYRGAPALARPGLRAEPRVPPSLGRLLMAAGGTEAPGPSRPEPREDSRRLDGAFDNRGPEPPDERGLGGLLADLWRGENRAASLNAAAAFLSVREHHAIPSLSRERTSSAITTLRGFRLELGHTMADPGFSSRLVASSASSPRRIAKATEQIRGIERHYMDADGEPDAPDARRRYVLGLTLSGRDEIEAFEQGRRDTAAELRALLDSEPYASLSKLILAVGLFVSPLTTLPHRLGGDSFAEAVSRELSGGSASWRFDSRTYAIQQTLIDMVLRHGKVDEILAPQLWLQDGIDSAGMFMRLTGSFPESPSRAAPYQWLTLDRLLWRRPEREPLLVLTARTSSTRPRFPRPARRGALEEFVEGLFAPAPQPVPIPVPGRRPGPRR